MAAKPRSPWVGRQQNFAIAVGVAAAATWFGAPTLGLYVAAVIVVWSWPGVELFEPQTSGATRAEQVAAFRPRLSWPFTRPTIGFGPTGATDEETAQFGWRPATRLSAWLAVAGAAAFLIVTLPLPRAHPALWPIEAAVMFVLLQAAAAGARNAAWPAPGAAFPAVMGDREALRVLAGNRTLIMVAAAAAVVTPGLVLTAAWRIGELVDWTMPTWWVAAVAATVGLLAGAAVLAASHIRATNQHLRDHLAASEAWQLRWLAVPKLSVLPPTFISEHAQPPVDTDLPETHRIAFFSVPAGATIEDYRARTDVLGSAITTDPSQSDLVLVAPMQQTDEHGQPIPGTRQESTFSVTYNTTPFPPHSHLAGGLDDWSTKFAMHRAFDRAFAGLKLGTPDLVRVQPLHDMATAAALWDTVWQLPANLTYDKLIGKADQVAEKIGAPWLRIGRRMLDSQGRKVADGHVSIIFGADPDQVAYTDPEMRPWLDSLELERAFVALKLGAPLLQSTTRLSLPGHPDLVEARFQLESGTSWADVIRKAAGVAETLGVPWLRVTRRIDAAGDPSPYVSVLYGANPAETVLASGDDRLFVEAADWDTWFRACKLVGPGGTVPRLLHREQVTDDIVAGTFRAAEGVAVEAVRKAVPALQATSGLAYLEVHPDSDGHANRFRLLYATDDPLPSLVPVAEAVNPQVGIDGAWHFLPAGVTAAGQHVGWDLQAGPHGLITGQTGSGKSVMLQAIVYSALLRGLEVTVLDPVKEGADFRFAAPWCEHFVVELHHAADVIETLYDEVRNRKKVNAENGVGNWMQLPDELRPTPKLVVIDEAFSLLARMSGKTDAAQYDNEAKDRIADTVGRIAREARSAGVHMVLAAQRPDAKVLAGELKNNLGLRVLVGSGSETVRQMVFVAPEMAPEIAKGLKGRAVLELEGSDPVVIQGFYSPTEELAERLADHVEPRHQFDPSARFAGLSSVTAGAPAAYVEAPPQPDGLWSPHAVPPATSAPSSSAAHIPRVAADHDLQEDGTPDSYPPLEQLLAELQ